MGAACVQKNEDNRTAKNVKKRPLPESTHSSLESEVREGVTPSLRSSGIPSRIVFGASQLRGLKETTEMREKNG